MKSARDLLPITVFAALAFVIVIPLLSPGYIMTLDNISLTIPIPPSFGSPYFLFMAVYWVLGKFIPLYLLQKSMLFLIFFLSGWGMYRLIPIEKQVSKMFSGLIYSLNSFFFFI